MSPRPANPEIRRTLIDVAARLLAEEGPAALSTRRLAAQAGSSTMAVYTHFGAMGELVREMVYEGFARLQDYLTSVRVTDDPVADLALQGRAYRHNAVTNSHLFPVMFGGASVGGFTLTEADRRHGRYTLVNAVEATTRCVEAGRFRSGDPELMAHHMWSAVHGLSVLEVGGYLIEPYNADLCFESQLVGLMVGAGDRHEAAVRSVARSRERFLPELGAVRPG